MKSSEPVVIWGYIFGGRVGDEMRLQITGPSGEVIDKTEVLDRNQAQLFRATGRRAPVGGWDAGTYRGTIDLIRDGTTVDTLHTDVTVR